MISSFGLALFNASVGVKDVVGQSMGVVYTALAILMVGYAYQMQQRRRHRIIYRFAGNHGNYKLPSLPPQPAPAHSFVDASSQTTCTGPHSCAWSSSPPFSSTSSFASGSGKPNLTRAHAQLDSSGLLTLFISRCSVRTSAISPRPRTPGPSPPTRSTRPSRPATRTRSSTSSPPTPSSFEPITSSLSRFTLILPGIMQS